MARARLVVSGGSRRDDAASTHPDQTSRSSCTTCCASAISSTSYKINHFHLPNVSLRELSADKVFPPIRKQLFETVQRGKEGDDGFLVRGLGGCKTGFVDLVGKAFSNGMRRIASPSTHSVVNGVVDPALILSANDVTRSGQEGQPHHSLSSSISFLNSSG